VWLMRENDAILNDENYWLREFNMRIALIKSGLVLSIAIFAGACTPKVEVVAPEKPITINLNVKIEHEIRVKVDKDLDKVFSEDKGLF
jgi:hypothetical protein